MVDTNIKTLMRFIQTFLAGIALLALAGCRTAPTSHASKHDFSGIPATIFSVSVSGTAGLKFTGSMMADGQTQEVSGTVPAQYEVTAHELICSFKKTDAEGSMALAVSEPNGGVQGRCNTPKPWGGVRVEILRTPSRQHTLFTTF